ncbi:MAG: 4Fe-4S dicluster domain-containing protein [Armatimonadetes bacterium]|nr:4Fe-4S dicluster domain-containing protein [Armatimonadota bacterium]
MSKLDFHTQDPPILEAEAFGTLWRVLNDFGYQVVGPALRDGAIRLVPLESADDLPRGIRDLQTPGNYRTSSRDDGYLFGYSHVADGAKRWLLRPRTTLWRISRRDGQPTIEESRDPVPKVALLGLRACDLKAIEILDRVMLRESRADTDYAECREQTLLIAVNCEWPSSLCFCESMGAGPQATGGFDLCLTELPPGGDRFLVEVGSPKGHEILSRLNTRPATTNELHESKKVIARAKGSLRKRLETRGLTQALYSGVEDDHWERVAGRCFACGNCTFSCPTCFCCDYQDLGEIHQRVWDTCFHSEFSGLHGGAVRGSRASKYRHWITHKLASWQEQFQTLGCVGCGRCIAWCPAGIDLTEEARALVGVAQGDTK